MCTEGIIDVCIVKARFYKKPGIFDIQYISYKFYFVILILQSTNNADGLVRRLTLMKRVGAITIHRVLIIHTCRLGLSFFMDY